MSVRGGASFEYRMARDFVPMTRSRYSTLGRLAILILRPLVAVNNLKLPFFESYFAVVLQPSLCCGKTLGKIYLDGLLSMCLPVDFHFPKV
jgi:hypothetical protein